MKKISSNKAHIFRLCLYAMLGALMFATKAAMELLPNIHLVGMLTILYTLLLGWKALIPIYVYVFLDGIFSIMKGALVWWFPYLYIWAILWGLTMLVPKKTPAALSCVIYPALCSLHGLAFGTLYAPAWAVINHFTFKQMLSWIAVGFSFDLIHMVSNFCMGLLILPLYKAVAPVLKNKI